MPRNNLGEITRSWMFESSSGNGVYETLQYTTGALSCSCPGWTRRVDSNGDRSCKHTRLVEAGLADQECAKSKVYGAYNEGVQTAANYLKGPKAPAKVSKFPKPAPAPVKVKTPAVKPDTEPVHSRFRKRIDVPVDSTPVDEDRFKDL